MLKNSLKTGENTGERDDGDLGYKLWEESSKDLKEIQSILSKSI